MKTKFNGILTLLLALTVQFVFAQKTVSGTVSDESGALPGVSVMIKGTKTGTETDFDGKYSLQAKQGDVLVYSYVGKVTTEKTVGSANTIDVKLMDDANVLDEVVITTALGIKKVKDAVTSTTIILDGDQLKAASNPDAIRSLAGKVSGVTVNSTSNGVQGTNSIRIRSMLSITGNTEALVIIDNITSSADILASLPPDVIASISILKGAQAAAIYGSLGKQGAVIVTTKKGTNGNKFSLSLNTSVDFEDILFVPERQTNYGQGWYGSWDRQENGGWGPKFDGVVRPVGIPGSPDGELETPYSTKGSDVIKDFYNQGYILQNSLNISSANTSSSVSLNIANNRRNFILEGDDLNKTSILLNAGSNIGKVSLSGNITYINSKVNQANVYAATSRSDYTLLTNLLQTASNIPIDLFKDRGMYGWNGYFQNPYWAKENNRLDDINNTFVFGINADYKLNDRISFTHVGSVQFQNNGQRAYGNQAIAPVTSDGDFSSPSYFFQSSFKRLNFYGDFLMNINFDLTDNIGLKANLGQNFQYFSRNRMSQGGTTLDVPGFYHITNVLSPANPTALLNEEVKQKTTGTFLNTDLNYSDYLFLNLTARYEGNSVAPKGSQFYFYPSVGLSFIPTKAIKGFEDNNIISKTKAFVNYTKIGSLDPIEPYAILSLASNSTNFPYGSLSSYNNLTTIVDPDIKPEMYTTLEAGVNLGLFKNVLTLDASVYKTTTSNLITEATVPYSTGLGKIVSNRGELEAKGLEIDLGYKFFKDKAFKWDGNASYSTSETIVTDSGDSDKITLYDGGNSQTSADVSGVKNLPFPYITGTDWIRDSQGNVIIGANGNPTPTSVYQNLGRAIPKYIVGLTNNFSFKNFRLAFTLDYRTGHYFISQTKYNLTWNGHLYESGEFDRNVGFLYPNSVIDNPATPQVDYIPNTTVLTGGGYTLTGSANKTQAYYGLASNLGAHNLIDATSFRVREVSVSYSLKPEILERVGLSELKFSVNARNPFILLAEGNRGYADPEASSQRSYSNTSAAQSATGTFSNTSANGIGIIGDANYPSTKTFGFAVNITF